MRRSLQYSLVNQVLYAIDATITAKSLEKIKTEVNKVTYFGDSNVRPLLRPHLLSRWLKSSRLNSRLSWE